MGLVSFGLLCVLIYPWLSLHLVDRLQGKARILLFSGPILALGLGVASYITNTPFELGYPAFIGLRVDALSGILISSVLCIGVTVLAYTQRHLRDDDRQKSFQLKLSLLLIFAVFMLLSPNLVQLFFCWFGTSFFLHRLLTHFSDRARAKAAAYQKFWISRLGDVFIMVSLLMFYGLFKTLDFNELTHLVRQPSFSETSPTALTIASICFVLGCAIKSAQFPFHAWLPNTMDTPVPVSAIMHAGIINAGGYAVIRLSPILSQSSLALSVLVGIGAVSVVIGTLSMLAQPTVKKSLAYSTIAQMGFMLLQCGLGFFVSAAVHMVGHAFYKAYAFLNSGTATDLGKFKRYFPIKDSTQQSQLYLYAGVLCFLGIFLLSHLGFIQRSHFPLLIVLASTSLQMFRSSQSNLRSLVLSLIVVISYFGLNYGAGFLFHNLVADQANVASYETTFVEVCCGFVFIALHLFQARCESILMSDFGKKLYVKSLNGWA